MNWYSTCIRRLCLIEGTGGVRYEDAVFLLRAAGWDEARQKAMAIGESREERYTNEAGVRVRWAFERVVSLDELGTISDGTEVYSAPVAFDGPPVPFDHRFTPGDGAPTQSV